MSKDKTIANEKVDFFLIKAEVFNPGPAKINPNMPTSIFGKTPLKNKPNSSEDNEVSS